VDLGEDVDLGEEVGPSVVARVLGNRQLVDDLSRGLRERGARLKRQQADVRQLQLDQHERTGRAARGMTTGYDYRSDVLTAPGTLLCMAPSWPVVGK
jgi:hypothetical protein